MAAELDWLTYRVVEPRRCTYCAHEATEGVVFVDSTPPVLACASCVRLAHGRREGKPDSAGYACSLCGTKATRGGWAGPTEATMCEACIAGALLEVERFAEASTQAEQ